MTWKPWPIVTKFSSNGKHFYYNKGTTHKGEDYLAINTQSGDRKERCIVYKNQALEFLDHAVEAVKKIYGFDYRAYIIAQTESTVDVSPYTVDNWDDRPFATEFDEPMSRLGEVEKIISTEVLRGPSDPNACKECGEPPGDGWKFGIYQGNAISQCPNCGKIHRG